MSKSKVETINSAFEILRISGLTTNPTPEELTLGLDSLEGMMHEFEARNICSSYNFEDDPELNSDANIELAYQKPVEYNLALRLAPFFGVEPSPSIVGIAASGRSTWAAASSKTKQIRYPNRQPVGSGNNFRYRNWQRYYRQDKGAPIDCETNYIKVGETNNFKYDFTQYLNSETITSYTTDDSNGVDLISTVQQTNTIIMTVTGVQAGTQSITITVTTNTGRVNPQKIYFQVIDQG